MRQKRSKPDYQFIQSHSCKEFVEAVRRLIMHEKLFSLRDVRHIDKPDTLDILLFGRTKVWIVRHFKGSTQAVIQGFPIQLLEMLTDDEKPDIDEFLREAAKGVAAVDLKLWFPRIS